jgi:hypothetical protein
MKYVYVVLVGIDFEGEELKGIFEHEDQAKKLKEKLIKDNEGDHVIYMKWEVK